jgi:hypothetical protein
MENQLKIIKKHCGDIRKRIEACRTKEIANLLKNQICMELQSDCPSEMVSNIMHIHVDKIIAEIFDAEGKNKYLEE